jgi:hypothetical protein
MKTPFRTTVGLGWTRHEFNNERLDQLKGLPTAIRTALSEFSYASDTMAGVRYVRGDRFLVAVPTPGLFKDTVLDRESAGRMADAFVAYCYGPDAERVNTHSLDVSPTNVRLVKAIG